MPDPLVKAVEDLNRTMKEVKDALKQQNRLLERWISGQLKKPETTSDISDPTTEKVAPEPLQIYGWSMANLVQSEGRLLVGDQKIMPDDSHWVWTGEIWERLELPSAREPD